MPPGAADCQDPGELAVIQAEGSPMGPLLRAVNEIARALAADFPLVAVDTLAYQCASGGRQTVLCCATAAANGPVCGALTEIIALIYLSAAVADTQPPPTITKPEPNVVRTDRDTLLARFVLDGPL